MSKDSAISVEAASPAAVQKLLQQDEKRMAEFLDMSSDGKIWFESEHGQGSTFHFTSRFGLPSPLPATDSVAPTPDAGLTLPLTSAHAASLKILLVEDNPVNQLLTVRLLQKGGHHVTVANSGLLDIRKWEVETFDLILIDGQM